MGAGSPGKSLELDLGVGHREVKRRAGRKEAGRGGVIGGVDMS